MARESSVGKNAKVTESGIEGRGPEKDTIRKNKEARKAGAGHVGATNVNHA